MNGSRWRSTPSAASWKYRSMPPSPSARGGTEIISVCPPRKTRSRSERPSSVQAGEPQMNSPAMRVCSRERKPRMNWTIDWSEMPAPGATKSTRCEVGIRLTRSFAVCAASLIPATASQSRSAATSSV